MRNSHLESHRAKNVNKSFVNKRWPSEPTSFRAFHVNLLYIYKRWKKVLGDIHRPTKEPNRTALSPFQIEAEVFKWENF